ncbi:MAG: hypothetical protein OEO77_01350 [Acidimicrobiia bacterium]|nr:hypothetical protein [Acidimicrobiia bacterium]
MVVTRFLAHQSGWDETLIFVAVVAVGLYVLKRVERTARQRADAGDALPDDASPRDDAGSGPEGGGSGPGAGAGDPR